MTATATAAPARAPARAFFATLRRAAGAACAAWRLLLLWVLLSLLPAAWLALPLWRLLGASFDYSVQAPALLTHIDLVALADVVHNYGHGSASLPLGALQALALTLLLSPWLTAMVLSAARANTTLGFRALLAGGANDYLRMARMLLVALLPLVLASLLGNAAAAMAERYADGAVLASAAAHASLAATVLMALLLMLADASVDTGRAILALDRRRRSAFIAWWQGCKLLARHPLLVLGAYLPLSLAGLAVAAALAMARAHLAPIGAAAIVGALLLTQLVVLTLAWMRTARLFALIAVVRDSARR